MTESLPTSQSGNPTSLLLQALPLQIGMTAQSPAKVLALLIQEVEYQLLQNVQQSAFRQTR